MDLEHIRAAWQREEFEGYLFETPPKRIAADLRRKAGAMDRQFARDQTQQILWGLLYFGLMALRYDSRLPIYANVGVTLILLAGAHYLISSFILRSRFRLNQSELPGKEYLAEQRKRIMARISALRRNMIWSLIPLTTGLGLWLAAILHSPYGVALVVTLMASTTIASAWFCNRRIRKEFLPSLEAIEREIAASDETHV